MRSGAFWSGWIMFAAVMMGLIGVYDVFQGLAAIFSDDYVFVAEDRLVALDFTAWGFITLVWGVALVLGAFALYSGRTWARWFALIAVTLHAVSQTAFIDASPVWSLIVIGLSALVVFALAARWDEAQADLSGPV